MVDTALKDAATMAMGANCDAMDADRIKDELSVRGIEMIQALLDDMISVEVLDQFYDLARERFDDEADLC
jgi:hypothetical protein